MLDDKMRIMIADSILASLEEDRKEHESTVKLANKMLTMQKFVPFIAAFIGFFISGLINSSDFIRFAMYGGCVGIICSIPLRLFSYCYWEIVRKKYEKKLMEIDEKIGYVLIMKKALEKEITKSNGKEFDSEQFKLEFIFTPEFEEELDFADASKQDKKTKKRVKKIDKDKKNK